MWNGVQTHMWHYLHFWGTTDYIYGFGKLFCSFIFLPIHHPSTHISTLPQKFLPIQMTGGLVSA